MGGATAGLFMADRGSLAADVSLSGEVLHGEALSGAVARIGEKTYVLSDIIAPAIAPLSAKPAPYAEAARRFLQSVLDEGVATEGAYASDRWGRLAGRLLTARDRGAVQAKLVAAGAARVRPMSGDHGFIRDLLAMEVEARARRVGLWSLNAYAVRAADAPRRIPVGGFEIVEGVVRQAARRRGRVYINFGADYRRDFTVTVKAAAMKRWTAPLNLGENGDALAGRRVRARGAVQRINGPSIELDHELQLEFAD